MKATKKKLSFVLSIVFVSLLAVGYRTILHFVGLRNVATSTRQTIGSCGVPVAYADVPAPPASVGEGGGGEGGCEGEGEGEGGCG